MVDEGRDRVSALAYLEMCGGMVGMDRTIEDAMMREVVRLRKDVDELEKVVRFAGLVVLMLSVVVSVMVVA